MMTLKSTSMADIVKIVYSFLGWVQQILNALGIHSFDEPLSNAMSKLA